MSYLGIDLGTSGLRLLLVDDEGAPLASVERGYEVRRPKRGWAEQDPADWIAALHEAVAELRQSAPAFADMRGIGTSGHMHGAVLLDAGGAVLRPAILWNDNRASAEAARLDATPGVREASGNIVFPGFTAPKLLWLRHHEPEVFARVAKVLLPAAYLNFYLTGEAVGDLSDASGTSWLDLAARRWSPALLAAGGMEPAQMPRLVEGSEAAGELRADLARAWGLSRDLAGGITVAGGAGDNAAAACGIGALHEGEGFVSLGTSGVVLVARDACQPAPEAALHTFCHAVPGRYYQMGVMLSATDSLNWLSRVTGESPAALTRPLGAHLLPPGRVRFLPYLSGERTPHNDAEARGSFTGLSAASGRTDLTRAVLEGVSFGLGDSLAALKSAGARPERLFAIGGGARSAYWVRLLATTLDLPLALPKGAEFGAALGAARLAQVASGGGTVEATMSRPDAAEVMDPDPQLAPLFAEAQEAFRATYPVLRHLP